MAEEKEGLSQLTRELYTTLCRKGRVPDVIDFPVPNGLGTKCEGV